MSKYDARGRRYIELSYLTLSDVPALVDTLATLADPGVDSLLAWDEDSDQLTWRTSPGDEGIIYAAYCNGSAGASVAITPNTAAAAWTVTQISTGRFKVTHNLNLSNTKYLAVVANVTLNAGGTDDRYCTITGEDADYFEVLVNDVGSGAVNDDFYFHAVRLAV